MFVISRYNTSEKNAGPKAQKDVENILKKNYNAHIFVLHEYAKKNLLKKRIEQIKYIIKYSFNKDLTIVQFPISNNDIYIKNLKNKVAFIHDLNGLRNENKEILNVELNQLKQFNFVIAHNKFMKEFLINNGINENKIITLEIFDYICNTYYKEKKLTPQNLKVAYSGNLSKSLFLHQLDCKKMNFTINLYGIGAYDQKNSKLKYYGSFNPDELPEILDGDLGLVWDGNLDSSDESYGLKNYTKYNNPHKLSCYLAAGIPVIVWDKSAAAEFVKKYDVGYIIKDIYDINNINLNNYSFKLENVRKISLKIRNGYYTKRAIEKVLNMENSWDDKNEI